MPEFVRKMGFRLIAPVGLLGVKGAQIVQMDMLYCRRCNRICFYNGVKLTKWNFPDGIPAGLLGFLIFNLNTVLIQNLTPPFTIIAQEEFSNLPESNPT